MSLAGCASKEPSEEVGALARELLAAGDRSTSPASTRPARSARRATRIGDRPRSAGTPGPTIDLDADDLPLIDLLRTLARETNRDLIASADELSELRATISVRAMPVDSLFETLEASFPIRIEARTGRVSVARASGPRLPVLVRPLDHGVLETSRPIDFEGLEQLSFISRSQRTGEEARVVAGPDARRDSSGRRTSIELFLERLPELVPWPEGSTVHFDVARNLVIVRSASQTLDHVDALLDAFSQPPPVIDIETRFVEVSDGFGRDLGVELELLDDLSLAEEDGGPKVAIGSGSATAFGLPDVANGLRATVLGLLSEPRFRALITAIELREDSEVLSAPSVTSINNSRATIAITTNLPFVEGFRPIFDQDVVASDGISTTDSTVALVAEINDTNFTGIVLNVTPSVGLDVSTLQLRLQPVVRTQVDEIVIAEAAVVEGVATPQIARPIIETRFLDTQLSLRSGQTIVLGGLKTSREATRVEAVPFLGSIPLLGQLFRRETRARESRDLLIFVTARVR